MKEEMEKEEEESQGEEAYTRGRMTQGGGGSLEQDKKEKMEGDHQEGD